MTISEQDIKDMSLFIAFTLVLLYAVACQACQGPLPSSCQEAYAVTPSGHYATVSGNVYCEMEEICGEVGWTRLGAYDFSDQEQSCPGSLRLYDENDGRGCGRATTNGASCDSIIFPSNGLSYTKVCGKILGYQYKTTDAFNQEFGGGDNDIESHYVDGVSVTHGAAGSRSHIFTLAAGVFEQAPQTSFDYSPYQCPCIPGSPQGPWVPGFVGTDYYCESGASVDDELRIFHTSDLLWDGEQCDGEEGDCCVQPHYPYFYKALGSATSDDIEVRVCADQETDDEDAVLEIAEIYVK